MDPNQYYQNLMQQGYNSADAVHFTQQYYPSFDGPAQGMVMMTPPPGSMEMGGMAAGGFGAPAGGMAAGGMAAGGAAAAGGGMSVATIAVVSVLVLGGVGTGGYFLYEYLTEPDFYGEVYWSDEGFGYMFEEDSISIVMAQYEGSCEMFDDFEGEDYTLTEKDDLCFLEMDFETTVTDKGDYYDVCVTDDGEPEECLKIYIQEKGMIMIDDSDFCEVFVSDIEPPSEFISEQNAQNWMDDFQDKSDSIKDDGPSSCQYSLDYDESSGGSLDTFQFTDRDAAGQMTDGGGDALVHVKMTQGNDLSWAVLKVTIVVEGGYSLACQEAGNGDDNSDCTYAIDDDNYWSVSEEITISEGAYDLCDGSNGGCSVDVTITKLGVGNEDDRVLATVFAYADAYN